MGAYLTNQYFSSNTAELARIIGTIVIIAVAMASLITVICIGLLIETEKIVGIPKPIILIIPAICVVLTIYNLHLIVLRNENNPWGFGAVENVKTIIDSAITVFCVAALSFGWLGRVLGVGLSSLISGGSSTWALVRRKILRLEFSKERFLDILKFSFPLLPHSLGATAIVFLDRLFIDSLMGPEYVGIYTPAYQLGMMMLLVVTPVSKVWTPHVMKKLKGDNLADTKTFRNAVNIGAVVFIIAALAVWGIAELTFPILIDQSYAAGKQILPYVIISYGIYGVYMMLFPLCLHKSRTLIIAIASLCGAAINCVLNLSLIPYNGITGAAQATVIAYLVQFAIVYAAAFVNSGNRGNH